MVLSKSISLASKLILASLLIPEHFGLVSMIIVFMLVLKILADTGLKNTLVYRATDRATKPLYDTAFWLLLGIATIVVLVMWTFGAGLIAAFYQTPELEPIAAALSLTILVQNLQIVPEARLTRSMRFGRIALSELAGTVVGCGCAIVLALGGAGVWSLVAQILVTDVVTALGFFGCAHWRPRFRFDVRLISDMRRYSSYILGSRVLQHVEQNLDYLLIGKLLGAHALGVYSLAFLATETLRAQIYWVIGKVAFPVYSRIVSNPEKVRRVYLATVRYVCLAVFPISTSLILFAPSIVPLLLSPSWSDAVVPIQILAVASMVVASAGTPTEALRGLGRADRDFGIHLRVTFLVALPALSAGIFLWGLPGAAAGVLFYYSASWIFFHLAFRRAVGVRLRQVARAIAPAAAGSLIMVVVDLTLIAAPWWLRATASLLAYAGYVLAIEKAHWVHIAARYTGLPRSTPKPVMIILGPDGAGKSTLVKTLSNALPEAADSLYLGMGLDEPWAFRIVRSAYRFHLERRPGWQRALTGVAVWYLLMPIEFLARRRQASHGRHSRYVIIDRVPSRPFLQGGLLGAYYRWILPSADNTVLLVGDAVEIASRKPNETSLSRTVLDLRKWEQVANRMARCRVIRLDTTRKDPTSCTAILLAAFASKAAKDAAI
jgi:teichuronic acid exporter